MGSYLMNAFLDRLHVEIITFWIYWIKYFIEINFTCFYFNMTPRKSLIAYILCIRPDSPAKLLQSNQSINNYHQTRRFQPLVYVTGHLF